jgi:uridine kinase
VIRASIDGFHRPRAERYRRGRDSPRGYYEDSFDLETLRHVLLDPLGPGGHRRYRRVVFDFRSDSAAAAPVRVASEDALVLFDGVFLLRPELRDAWDLAIYVRVEPGENLRRALARDVPLLGPPAEVERRYRARYLPGQALYVEEARPLERADLVVVNDDPAEPEVSGR